MRARAASYAAIPAPRGGARPCAPRRRGAPTRVIIASCLIAQRQLIYNWVEGGATQESGSSAIGGFCLASLCRDLVRSDEDRNFGWL